MAQEGIGKMVTSKFRLEVTARSLVGQAIGENSRPRT